MKKLPHEFKPKDWRNPELLLDYFPQYIRMSDVASYLGLTVTGLKYGFDRGGFPFMDEISPPGSPRRCFLVSTHRFVAWLKAQDMTNYANLFLDVTDDLVKKSNAKGDKATMKFLREWIFRRLSDGKYEQL